MTKVFGNAALPLLAAVALMVGVTCHIISFASPYWANDGEKSLGLWKYGTCNRPPAYHCYRYDHQANVEGWLAAVRGLECIAIIMMAIPLVILPIYMYITMGIYSRVMIGVFSTMCAVAAVCIIVAIIVFGVSIADKFWSLEWCFFVNIVSAVAAILACVVLILVIVTKKPKEFYANRLPPFCPKPMHVYALHLYQ